MIAVFFCNPQHIIHEDNILKFVIISDLQGFPQSEKLASCDDEDFPSILKSLSFKVKKRAYCSHKVMI